MKQTLKRSTALLLVFAMLVSFFAVFASVGFADDVQDKEKALHDQAVITRIEKIEETLKPVGVFLLHLTAGEKTTDKYLNAVAETTVSYDEYINGLTVTDEIEKAKEAYDKFREDLEKANAAKGVAKIFASLKLVVSGSKLAKSVKDVKESADNLKDILPQAVAATGRTAQYVIDDTKILLDRIAKKAEDEVFNGGKWEQFNNKDEIEADSKKLVEKKETLKDVIEAGLGEGFINEETYPIIAAIKINIGKLLKDTDNRPGESIKNVDISQYPILKLFNPGIVGKDPTIYGQPSY